jgi:hypothetical protein
MVVRTRLAALVALASVAACVHVPDTIRAEFAAPGPADRSNFRPGLHGAAPPNEEPPAAKAAEPAAADAGAPTPPAGDFADPFLPGDAGAKGAGEPTTEPTPESSPEPDADGGVA